MITSLEQLRAGLPAGTRHLTMSCGLTEFPREIFNLADTLEMLDLSGNALSSLPDDLPRLGKLRIIFCSNNRFTELPDVLGRCPRLSMIGFKANKIVKVSGAALPKTLRWLILTDNQVATLPPAIGNCTQLQKLMLAGNQLSALPPALAECSRLELLRLAANQFDELPAWLTSMPRLSWLAFAGNPMSEAMETGALMHTRVESIDWKDLALQDVLGEGASGVIYRAEYSTPDGANRAYQPAAVKRFKGAMTSDGLPLCEMAACMSAGEHLNLISVLGKISANPPGDIAPALVLSLIDPQFTNLAGPPSLDTCTRDIYAHDFRLSRITALKIALGVASAARHLHAKGIMHGDLYAHNILHCDDGRALLGDFGAASFYSMSEPDSELLQRLEVRAFGCLLEELIDRSDSSEPSTGALAIALKNRCLSETVNDRPLFDEIVEVLHALVSA